MKKKKLKGKVKYIVPVVVLALLVLVGAFAAQYLAGSSSVESVLRALRSLRLVAAVVACFLWLLCRYFGLGVRIVSGFFTAIETL